MREEVSQQTEIPWTLPFFFFCQLTSETFPSYPNISIELLTVTKLDDFHLNNQQLPKSCSSSQERPHISHCFLHCSEEIALGITIILYVYLKRKNSLLNKWQKKCRKEGNYYNNTCI
uniref:Uncharacterized protein n=1 Tax=Callorhinchus milii TaxID=7868 RepID=A0A4W3JVR7_CALMI